MACQRGGLLSTPRGARRLGHTPTYHDTAPDHQPQCHTFRTAEAARRRRRPMLPAAARTHGAPLRTAPRCPTRSRGPAMTSDIIYAVRAAFKSRAASARAAMAIATPGRRGHHAPLPLPQPERPGRPSPPSGRGDHSDLVGPSPALDGPVRPTSSPNIATRPCTGPGRPSAPVQVESDERPAVAAAIQPSI